MTLGFLLTDLRLTFGEIPSRLWTRQDFTDYPRTLGFEGSRITEIFYWSLQECLPSPKNGNEPLDRAYNVLRPGGSDGAASTRPHSDPRL